MDQKRESKDFESDDENKTEDPKEQITFENFGMKMLEQMGFKQKGFIGKKPTTYSDQIYELKSQQPGVGLGAFSADPTATNKRIKNSTVDESKFKPNDLVFVVEGKHKGAKAVVKENRDDEFALIEINGADVLVKLSEISKQRPKAVTELLLTEGQKPAEKERRIRWAAPGLVVRVVSQELAVGKYYLKKGSILDVGANYFVLMMQEDGGLLEEVREKQVETVVPPVGGKVMVVRGQLKGVLAQVFRKEKSTSKIWLKKIDDEEIVEVTPDDCCLLADN